MQSVHNKFNKAKHHQPLPSWLGQTCSRGFYAWCRHCRTKITTTSLPLLAALLAALLGKSMKLSIYIVVFIFSHTCVISHARNITITCSDGIAISGRVEDKVGTFKFTDNYKLDNDLPIVMGKINVRNTTNTELDFSTRMLEVKFNESAITRTYKKTIASEMINFGAIKLKPNSVFEIKVYWAPDLKVGEIIYSVSTSCAEIT